MVRFSQLERWALGDVPAQPDKLEQPPRTERKAHPLPKRKLKKTAAQFLTEAGVSK